MDRLARWNATFDLYDVDRDDAISTEDTQRSYESVLRMKGMPEETVNYYRGMLDKYQQAMLTADLNQDGKTTREEWHTFYSKDLDPQGTGSYMPSAALLRTIRTEFGCFDLDGDGVVNFSDYCKAALAFRIRANVSALRVHWAQLCQRVGASDRLDADQFAALEMQMWCYDGDMPFIFPSAPGPGGVAMGSQN